MVDKLTLFFRSTAVQAVHRGVKSVQDGSYGLGESSRIVLNFAKVATHCYGTLSFCITLPRAMKGMLAALSIFAADFAVVARVPCWLSLIHI